MFCPYCGHNVPEESVFCSFCGENIGDAFFDEDASQSDEIFDTPNENVDVEETFEFKEKIEELDELGTSNDEELDENSNDIVKANELYEKAIDIITNADDYLKRSDAISVFKEALDCISGMPSSDMYIEIEKSIANEITIFAMLCVKDNKEKAIKFESALKYFSCIPENVFYGDNGDSICNFATSVLGYCSITGKKHDASKTAYEILLSVVNNNAILENNLGFAYAALGDFNFKGIGIEVNVGRAELYYMKAQNLGFDCSKKLIEVQG